METIPVCCECGCLIIVRAGENNIRKHAPYCPVIWLWSQAIFHLPIWSSSERRAGEEG